LHAPCKRALAWLLQAVTVQGTVSPTLLGTGCSTTFLASVRLPSRVKGHAATSKPKRVLTYVTWYDSWSLGWAGAIETSPYNNTPRRLRPHFPRARTATPPHHHSGMRFFGFGSLYPCPGAACDGDTTPLTLMAGRSWDATSGGTFPFGTAPARRHLPPMIPVCMYRIFSR
jgi:hypothetical protein